MAKRRLIHVASQVFNTPLAIVPEKLESILSGLGSRLVADQEALDCLLASGQLRGSGDGVTYRMSWGDDEDSDYDTDSPSKKPYTLTDAGIAIIPVSGVLMESGGWMSSLSGCSSYEGISSALDTALADASVNAILFKINSPGGSSHGCFELCDKIYSSRGKKPLWSIAKHLAASAAYAIASATDRIAVTMTGAVGSIGVYALHCDQSKLDDRIGISYTYVKFGARKTDGNEHEPLSRTAKSDIQAEVDRQGEMFVSRVSRNRGVKASRIADTEAGVFYAESSVPLLADAVCTYDDCLADLTQKLTGVRPGRPVSRNGNSNGATMQGNDVADEIHAAKPVKEDDVENDDDETENDDTDDTVDAVESPEPETCNTNPEGEHDPMTPEEMKKKKAEDDAAAAAAAAAVATAASTATTTQTQTQPAAAAPVPVPASAIAPVPDAPADAATVMQLCSIAGQPISLALEYVDKKLTSKQVLSALNEKRSAADSANPVSGHFGVVSTDALDTVNAAASALVSSGAAPNKAAAILQVLKSNPHLYANAENERLQALELRSQHGRYLQQMTQRLPDLGLSAGPYTVPKFQ